MNVYSPTLVEGRVAVVTGGGTGIGRGITRALLQHGASAMILGRRAQVLEQAAAELEAETGGRCLAVPADVREPGDVEEAIERALEEFGRLDIVVNNAAGNFLAPASELSYEAFRTVVEIDTLGTFNVCKAAYSRWLAEHGGNIVNISATLHYRGMAMQTHPVAAKAAIDAMTRNLAIEWGPQGVRVNAVAPGPIGDTEGLRRLLPKSMRARFEESVPLGRLGSIADIANATLFLTSEAASFVTGAILVVDGGSWTTMPTWDQL